MEQRAPLAGESPPFQLLDPILAHMQGLASDSRRVTSGMGFAAYPGEAGDGRRWVDDAVHRGASAVLWEPAGAALPELPLPRLAVPDLARHASRIAARVYGDPSAQLTVIGVTGTNGKTSSTVLLAQALGSAGRACAVMGTLGTGMPGHLVPSGWTTPGAVELQQQLAELRAGGAEAVAMEVSSHGLALGRVDGVHFALALFTNLTRDHLDFHGSMEAYAAAKTLLFRAVGLRCAVINLDDPFGANLAGELRRDGLRVVVATQDPRARPDAPYVCARDPQFSPQGIDFILESDRGVIALATRLVGRFNLANLLGVIGCLFESGVALDALPSIVAALEAPAGRLQRLGHAGGVQVIVDYAHTPDALEQALRTLRDTRTSGRILCVFGCGGDRDPGKRPQMGAIAEQWADEVILTSDNPRSEDPQSILDDIAAGMRRPPRLLEVDRARAIAAAIALAQAGDLVLIAGKGHETTQEIAGIKTPFSDVDIAQAILDGARPTDRAGALAGAGSADGTGGTG